MAEFRSFVVRNCEPGVAETQEVFLRIPMRLRDAAVLQNAYWALQFGDVKQTEDFFSYFAARCGPSFQGVPDNVPIAKKLSQDTICAKLPFQISLLTLNADDEKRIFAAQLLDSAMVWDAKLLAGALCLASAEGFADFGARSNLQKAIRTKWLQPQGSEPSDVYARRLLRHVFCGALKARAVVSFSGSVPPMFGEFPHVEETKKKSVRVALETPADLLLLRHMCCVCSAGLSGVVFLSGDSKSKIRPATAQDAAYDATTLCVTRLLSGWKPFSAKRCAGCSLGVVFFLGLLGGDQKLLCELLNAPQRPQIEGLPAEFLERLRTALESQGAGQSAYLEEAFQRTLTQGGIRFSFALSEEDKALDSRHLASKVAQCMASGQYTTSRAQQTSQQTTVGTLGLVALLQLARGSADLHFQEYCIVHDAWLREADAMPEVPAPPVVAEPTRTQGPKKSIAAMLQSRQHARELAAAHVVRRARFQKAEKRLIEAATKTQQRPNEASESDVSTGKGASPAISSQHFPLPLVPLDLDVPASHGSPRIQKTKHTRPDHRPTPAHEDMSARNPRGSATLGLSSIQARNSFGYGTEQPPSATAMRSAFVEDQQEKSRQLSRLAHESLTRVDQQQVSSIIMAAGKSYKDFENSILNELSSQSTGLLASVMVTHKTDVSSDSPRRATPQAKQQADTPDSNIETYTKSPQLQTLALSGQKTYKEPSQLLSVADQNLQSRLKSTLKCEPLRRLLFQELTDYVTTMDATPAAHRRAINELRLKTQSLSFDLARRGTPEVSLEQFSALLKECATQENRAAILVKTIREALNLDLVLTPVLSGAASVPGGKGQALRDFLQQRDILRAELAGKQRSLQQRKAVILEGLQQAAGAFQNLRRLKKIDAQRLEKCVEKAKRLRTALSEIVETRTRPAVYRRVSDAGNLELVESGRPSYKGTQ